MKKRLILRASLVFLAALAVVAGCQKPVADLHIYTWADYIKPELVQQFEKENNCKIVIDTFDSNEAMYAKLKAGATGYDLIMPSSYMAKIMFDQGMLLTLDKSRIPNLANIDPDYLQIAIDPQMKYSVPYMITYTGIGYLKDAVQDVKPTWKMLERQDLKGRMTMLNDMRETIGAALKSLGYSLNSVNDDELAAAKAVVIGWKKNVAKFENEQYKTGLASGEFLLVHGYSGDILKVKEENDQVEFLIPEEGFSLACDDLVIPKAAKQADLALKFINFLHSPVVAAANTEFITYLCPNGASYALLGDEIKNDPGIFPDPVTRSKGEVIKDLGENNQKYTKIWDGIKAAGD
jgi:spermidine/putrescine transport system substrate-binding protein